MIGTIHKIDIGSGGWKLICQDGREFELVGAISPDLEGKRVEITGTIEESFGFVMSGLPQLIVRSVQPT